MPAVHSCKAMLNITTKHHSHTMPCMMNAEAACKKQTQGCFSQQPLQHSALRYAGDTNHTDLLPQLLTALLLLPQLLPLPLLPLLLLRGWLSLMVCSSACLQASRAPHTGPPRVSLLRSAHASACPAALSCPAPHTPRPVRRSRACPASIAAAGWAAASQQAVNGGHQVQAAQVQPRTSCKG